MPAKIAKWSIKPTPADIDAFSGVHCADKWKRAHNMNWRCPSCDRSAGEIVRWSAINGATMRKRYADEHGMGWTTSIVTHHDHGTRRFGSTYLCGDCNSADGAAKRKLKLPTNWSFSPAELKLFVTVEPYSGRTVIDYDMAAALYWELTEAGK